MPAVPSSRRSRFKTRDVRFTVRIQAEPRTVYQALTSARELTRWWLLGAETDARNAGRVRMVWPRTRGADGRKPRAFGERSGVFVDLEPGRKVSWLFKRGRGSNGAPPLVSVFIGRRGKGSEVTLLHAGFPISRARSYEDHLRVWEDGLAKLKLYLEAGRVGKLETIDLEAARILTRARRRA